MINQAIRSDFHPTSSNFENYESFIQILTSKNDEHLL